jgi:hypothetical protein
VAVKYRFEHEFACDRDTLIGTMFGKGVGEKLLPLMQGMIEAETLSWEERGGRITRRVRYLPQPSIQSVGPKKVEPRWMEWIEESELDVKRGVATYRNVPKIPQIAELLKNHGEIEFTRLAQKRTRRVLSGELKVQVFLLGAIAERIIHGEARKLVDHEAEALQKLVASL